jgi:hypothetical protein
MSEESVLGTDRKYEVSPTHFHKIQQLLKEYPDRYNNEREFIFRAIDIFLTWETDPLFARKKMEELEPTIGQFAQMKMMMKPDQVEEMYPGFEERNYEEIQKFITKNPAYAGNIQTPEQEQLHERKSQHDFEKLVGSMNETSEFIRDIDFNYIIPEEGQKEIFYDEWPLLWTHYSRILPAKIAISAIVDLMNKQKKPVIKLNDKAKAHIYDIAEELAVKLRLFEKEEEKGREKRLSTGLPKPFTDDKITNTQALAEKRYKDRVIGKSRKSKNSGDISFDGLLGALGLVRTFIHKKEVYVTLTENGKKFYLLENSVFADDYSTAFSPEERKLLLTRIMPARKLEMKLIKETLKIVKEFEDEKLGDTQKITDRLDADFYFVIQQYVEKENTALGNQIKKDILEKTKEIKEWNATKKPEEDTKQSPIQAYRVATMGRLSEIGLIRWIIEANDEGHAVSRYSILDKEMATSIMKTK